MIGEAETKSLGRTTERVSRAQLKSEKIKVLGQREPLTVPAGSSMRESVAQMQAAQGECLIVVAEGSAPVGILTERDVLMKVLGREVAEGARVDDFMTPDPDTLTADATVGQALEMMDSGGYRNIPLVDDQGSLTGLLRQQDVLEYVAEAFPQEILNLPPRPHQAMEEQEGA